MLDTKTFNQPVPPAFPIFHSLSDRASSPPPLLHLEAWVGGTAAGRLAPLLWAQGPGVTGKAVQWSDVPASLSPALPVPARQGPQQHASSPRADGKTLGTATMVQRLQQIRQADELLAIIITSTVPNFHINELPAVAGFTLH